MGIRLVVVGWCAIVGSVHVFCFSKEAKTNVVLVNCAVVVSSSALLGVVVVNIVTVNAVVSADVGRVVFVTSVRGVEMFVL